MIALRKFEPSDYTTLINWVDSSELLMQFAGLVFTFPLTAQQLENVSSDSNKYLFKVVDGQQQNAIGHAEIHITKTSCYLARILIGDPKMRGKGLGKIIVRVLLQYAFGQLNQPKVELNVFDWNINAIRCYEQLGFIFNPGKRTTRIVNGKVWTALNMFLEKKNALAAVPLSDIKIFDTNE